jgi:hypothetical protein
MPEAAHSTKWIVVVASRGAAPAITLFGTQSEADAEFVRLREGGVAHVYVVPPASAGIARPARGVDYVL